MTDSAPSPQIVIETRGVNAPEVAAITAVLTAVLAERAASPQLTDAPASAWQRSQRAVRTPLAPGPGAWRAVFV